CLPAAARNPGVATAPMETAAVRGTAVAETTVVPWSWLVDMFQVCDVGSVTAAPSAVTERIARAGLAAPGVCGISRLSLVSRSGHAVWAPSPTTRESGTWTCAVAPGGTGT